MSELLKINVNEHTEKKNGLTYLSWAWAWAEVLKVDPAAEWEPRYFGPESNQVPWCALPDGSMMVGIRLVIKGSWKQCMLPVMDHRNKAIKNPDAFAVNTALMRCLAKCIAMHGLGLYIYAGEDLPEDDGNAANKAKGGDKAKDPDAANPVQNAYGEWESPDESKVKQKQSERTILMKYVNAIQAHIAADRELGVLQQYDEAWDKSEEFAASVWNSLTTPQQEYITRAQDALQAKTKKAA